MKNEEVTDVEKRVLAMSDEQILEVIIDKDGWQESLFNQAVLEAKKRELKIGVGSPESVKKQSDDVLVSIAKGILNSRPLGDITNQLIDTGVPISMAKEMVKKTAISIGSNKVNEWNDKWQLHAVICGAGVLITIGTYITSINGGTYILAWGAIIFGGIKSIAAFSVLRNWKKLVAEANAL